MRINGKDMAPRRFWPGARAHVQKHIERLHVRAWFPSRRRRHVYLSEIMQVRRTAIDLGFRRRSAGPLTDCDKLLLR